MELSYIIKEISQCLANEKSYNLPQICNKYNLDDGNEQEAFKSKTTYVRERLKKKNDEFILDLANKLIIDYEYYPLGYEYNKYNNGYFYKLTEITRQNLCDQLLVFPNLNGKLTPDIIKEKLSFIDFSFSSKTNDPFIDFLKSPEIYKLLDKQIFRFIEVLVDPFFRDEDQQNKLTNIINEVISVDNFQLLIVKKISNRSIYKISQSNGVKGKIKNIIFASNTYKPEIVLKDALNNDIEIVTQKNSVLVYDEPITENGLKWLDLVKWWSKTKNVDRSIKLAKQLKNRLCESINSKPEKDFFNIYYNHYAKIHKDKLPALIPQVYLHYDPYTIKKHGVSYLLRQRMDFLILFSNSNRIVIEIDGKQHYANKDTASPEKYSEMMKMDRELKFLNYEVYRLGGHELTYDTEKTTINFLDNLFEKYNLKI